MVCLRSSFVKWNSMHSLIVIWTRVDKRTAVVEVLRNCIQRDFRTTNKTKSLKLRIIVTCSSFFANLELNAHDTLAGRLVKFHCEKSIQTTTSDVRDETCLDFQSQNFTFFSGDTTTTLFVASNETLCNESQRFLWFRKKKLNWKRNMTTKIVP